MSSLQNTGRTTLKASGVFAWINSLAASFNADHFYLFIFSERIEKSY
jgi:hypothetical protein